MRHLLFWLIPAALLGGEARYARLGEIEGKPEIQLHAADAWTPGTRNTPLLDGSWVRTGPGSRAEIELDEGSAFRLDAASLAELSDYSRLSTGQRVTLVSLDRGVAYFTGAPQGRDSLVLAVPGAHIVIRRGARVRLEAREEWSQMAVIEGAVLFSSPAAELEIKEGSTVRVEPAHASKFYLYREVTALESDAWSEQRDKALAASGSASHVAGLTYGLADLDAAGAWIDTAEFGAVWKPKAAAGWSPFRNGRWAWYDELGYTWIAADPWGWLPYHYGRWTLHESSGWIWVPGKDATFSPGDVYWLRGTKLAGWGPLAPGEDWKPEARPRLYAGAHTTFAAFVPDALLIDPAGFAPPKEPVVAFIPAPASPPLPAARLDARRPVLRAGSTRVEPYLSGVTFEDRGETAAAPPPAEAPEVNTTVIQPAPPAPVVIVTPPPEPPREVYYPVPVSTGIVVINPPERDHRDYSRRPKPVKEEAKPPAPAPAPIPRSERVQERRPAPPATPPPAPAAAPPIPRGERVQERRAAPPPPPPAPAPAPKQAEPAAEPAPAKQAEDAPKPVPRNAERRPR